MKAGVAGMIWVKQALCTAGLEPAVDVHVQSVTETEHQQRRASVAGAWLPRRRMPDPRAYQSHHHAHTGTFWFHLRVRGVPMHVV
jgi:acetylornithine deacetylase